jgi:hypothetical protein
MPRSSPGGTVTGPGLRAEPGAGSGYAVGEDLPRGIKLVGLREVRDIAGMDDEGGLIGQSVDGMDGVRQRAADVVVRGAREAKMAVADLNK